MKYNVGDKVRIKSIDWYNENKDSNGNVVFSSKVTHFSWRENVRTVFTKDMSKFCGKVVTIETVWTVNYSIVEGTNIDYFTDEMIEGLVEEETEDKLKLDNTKTVREYWSEYSRIFIEIYDDKPNECVFTHLYTIEGHRQKGYSKQALIEAESIAKELGCHTAYLKVETDSWMHQWYLRMGYKWYKTADKEYTWLIKNLTSMEKKKKEYPKTYEECTEMLGEYAIMTHGYKRDLLNAFQKLLICRDAYWKIAGDEMGLGKPWEPDWRDLDQLKYCIWVDVGEFVAMTNVRGQHILAFPTEEMRDAFYENFKELIEICKELL